MNLLLGFLQADKGTIEICDIDLQKNPLKAKEFIGYLPEGAPAYSDMEVSDFLSFVGKMRGMEDSKLLKSRLSDMAEQINLKEVWNKPIETLSKGFKRRVGIAQALIHDPDILILDEPTDGLDPNQKYEMRNLLELAIKAARRWGYFTKGIPDNKAEIIIADGNFHGRTTTIVGFSSEEEYKKGFGPFGSGFLTADYCNNNCDCKQACTTSIESIKSLITKNTKLDINEAGFLKSNLDDVFRKITQQQ